MECDILTQALQSGNYTVDAVLKETGGQIELIGWVWKDTNGNELTMAEIVTSVIGNNYIAVEGEPYIYKDSGVYYFDIAFACEYIPYDQPVFATSITLAEVTE